MYRNSQAEILRPVSPLLVLATVVLALLLNSLPWEGIWLDLRPDFVALVLLYWSLYHPNRLGIGLAWAVGMLADVVDASLFGQHALAYTVLAFGGAVLHRRLQMFELREQTAQVFGILVLTYGVYALVHWQVNGYVAWTYFLGCLTSALIWIPLGSLLGAMGRRRAERRFS
ncbi:MAG: rod shape-determining protein MreD [Gallionella sp.]|jgi:rod shape-determining protein MreD|nr:rod shape-determining protein MreD [Gallionella sp.]